MLRACPLRCGHRRQRLDALAFGRHYQAQAIIPQRTRPVRMSNYAHKSLDKRRKSRFTIPCRLDIHASPPYA